jgi:hypothetical protein
VRIPQALAVAALLIGCGSSSKAPPPVSDAGHDARSDATSDARRDAPIEVRPARCCIVPTFGPTSPYKGCNLLTLIPDATVDLIQACWDGDAGPGFGRWQCGGQDGQDHWCAQGGLNCNVGDICWLQDEDSAAGGCVGNVQPCYYPWQN